MDDADRAQEINDQFQRDVLNRALDSMNNGVSRTHCEECEQPIPEGRRKAVPGCTLCIDCQNSQEELSKRRRVF